MQDKSLTEFEQRRLDRLPNKDVSPRDLLRLALDDIDSGRLDADALVIAAVSKKNDEWEYSYYRSKLNSSEEVLMYDVAHHHAMRRWER